MQGSSVSKLVRFNLISFLGTRNGNPTTRYFNFTRQLSTTGSKHPPDAFKFCNAVISPKYRSTILNHTHVRQFSEGPPKEFAGQKTIERFRVRDGVPKSYTLIYRSSFPNYLLFSQLLVFITTGAIITGTALYMLEPKKTDEEKQAVLVKRKEKVEEKAQRDRESPVGKMILEYREEHDLKEISSEPSLEDFVEGETFQIATVIFSFIVIAISIFRIQRILPVRIYASNKKHCIAIMYGHILPGRLTWHEFLAGTIVPVGRRKLEFYSNNLYKDGSGKHLVLLEQFFRSPEDYNRIMGFQRDFDEEEDEDNNNMRSKNRR